MLLNVLFKRNDTHKVTRKPVSISRQHEKLHKNSLRTILTHSTNLYLYRDMTILALGRHENKLRAVFGLFGNVSDFSPYVLLIDSMKYRRQLT